MSCPFREEVPPAQLLKSINAVGSFSPTPTWALAATTSADWASTQDLGLGIPRQAENCQQDAPFSDEDSNSDWERLSTASEAHVPTSGEEYADDKAPTKESFFFESYPSAMTAAGLEPAGIQEDGEDVWQLRTA